MVATSVNQSKKLLELGLNPETADMYYFLDPTPAGSIYHLTPMAVDYGIKNLPEYDKGDVSAWSLGALIEMLPKGLKKDNLHIIPSASLWHVGYDFSEHVERSDNLLEAVYATIIWLLENKYLKTK